MKKLFPGAEEIVSSGPVCYSWEMSNSSPLNYMVIQIQMYVFHISSMSSFSVYELRCRYWLCLFTHQCFGSYTGIIFFAKILAFQADRWNLIARISPVLRFRRCNVNDLIFYWLDSINEEEIIQGMSLRKWMYALLEVIRRKIRHSKWKFSLAFLCITTWWPHNPSDVGCCCSNTEKPLIIPISVFYAPHTKKFHLH